MKVIRVVAMRLATGVMTSVIAGVLLIVVGPVAVALLIGLLAFFAKLSAEGNGEYAPARFDLVVDWFKWCYSAPQWWIIMVVGAVIGFALGILARREQEPAAAKKGL